MSYQDNPFLPQMLSPAAHEIGRYGRTPVSHFHGLPNISIPLTEVRAKGFTIPVTLSYHAGGNKPDQHPGWVGLGWSLQAGGSIVRVVNGSKDEISSTELSSSNAEVVDYLSHVDEVQTETNWEEDGVLSSKSYDGVRVSNIDYSPDEYIINAPGIHASFYFTGEKKITVVSKDDSAIELEDYVVERSGSTILEMYPEKYPKQFQAKRNWYIRTFILKDKYGNRYIFGGDDNAIEYSVVQKAIPRYTMDNQLYNMSVINSYDNVVATANSWMLTKIERADGEVITFEYEHNGVPIVLNDIHYGYYNAFDSTVEGQYGVRYDTRTLMSLGIKYNLHFHFLIPSYLKRVKCLLSGDELLFETAPTQELGYDISEDDFNTYVYKAPDGLNAFLFSDFQEENHYMQLTRIHGVNRDIRFDFTDSSETRLKLKSVAFYNDNNEDNRYTFLYNQTPLPRYNSRMTDVWGYYNGRCYSDSFGDLGDRLDEVRVPDKDAMMAEILTAIQYPTGGWTYYDYEPHSYIQKCLPMTFDLITCSEECITGGLRIKSITDTDSANSESHTRTFEYIESVREGNIQKTQPSGILTAEIKSRITGTYPHSLSDVAFIIYSEMPLLPLSDTDGKYVTYSCVRECFPDGGYREYKYSNSDDAIYRDSMPAKETGRLLDFPLYPKFTSKSLSRGLLLNTRTFNSNGKEIMTEEMTYADATTEYFKGVYRFVYFDGGIILMSYIKHDCGYPGLIQKVVTRTLDDESQLKEIYTYTYNEQRLLESSQCSRESENYGERYYYPKDRSGNSYARMLDNKMYGVVVGKAVLRNGSVISGAETTYIEREVDTDMGTTRTVFLPEKTFSSQLDAPEPLSSFQTSPMSYMKPCPDAHAKAWDSRGNVRFVGFRKGTGSEYHWSQRTCQPVLKVQSKDVPLNSVPESQSLRIGYLSQEYSTSFKTIEGKPFVVALYADYGYAWYIEVRIDGVAHYLTSWSIAQEPNAIWKERIGKYPNNLSINLPAGNHTLVIDHVDWQGVPSSQTETGANVTYTYYSAPVYQDLAGFVDLDVDTESGEGFHCEKGHIGPLTVSHPVVAGKNYILDYMLKIGGVWQYRKIAYTGGNVTIGTSGQTVSNVRVYPSDSMPESFAWRTFTGMSARTDGHGVTESYAYDDVGRLSEVRDNSGSLIRTHSYEFKNSGDENDNDERDNIIATAEFTSSDGISKRSSVNHYDGLGRLVRNVLVDSSPSGGDLVTRHDFDSMDREVRTWLPQVDPASGDSIYGEDTTLYTENVYEASPLNRLLRTYGPGVAWRTADKATRMYQLSNKTDESDQTFHRGFSISWSGNNLTLARNSACTDVAMLLVEKTEDEDGRCGLEFKNVRGETVLIRQGGGTSWHDTHNIYDSFGRLAAVIPPKLTEELENSAKTSWTEDEIADLAYLYRYDSRGNCIAKLVPGGGWTYYVYDKGDRLVFSQDAVQRSNDVWSFRLEDLYGRECVKGTVTLDVDVFSDPLGNVNVYVTLPYSPVYSGLLKGYELTGFTLDSDVDVLNVNYHDGYGFLGSGPFPAATDAAAAYDSSAETDYGSRYTLSERGLATGSLVKVLDSSESGSYLWSIVYYDDKGRPVQTREATHMGGVRKEYFAYDFTGNVIKRKTMQMSSTGAAVTVIQSYTYDAMGRPLTTTHRIGNGAQRTISSKVYDDLGRLSADNRNGLASLKETRSYNLRSWLTNIDGQMFTEVLKYENSTIPQWGGNISVMQWGESAVQNAYSFIYDTHSRLQTANYSNASSVGLYSEIYNYDLNGNMLRHVRGSQPLVMNYSGNRLVSAGNAAFEYDAKGRQVMSAYGSGLSTVYNLLDLPQRQTTGEGTVVDYKYAFDGRKLQEKVTAGASVTQRDYSGEFLYEGGVLKKILFDGGYVINGESGPVYMFFLTDHLGSVRAVVSETGGVQQINHYYPYGDLFPNTSNDSSGNRYKYTGKESGDEIGLYDFSARFLHTRFGRFTTIDPLAEKYPDISPYAYCNGNPVNFVDPDGRSTWVVANGDGTYSVKGGNLEDNDLNIYVVDYDEEGKIRIGESIGKSSSITSFYDSDNHAWKEGSIINPMDASGYDFISELIQSDPSLIEYILKARTNHAYDFKATNGTRSKIQGIDVYRGMPIAINSDGTTIYSSARDIGNMIAGYIAGSKGLTWWMARMGFDAYQSIAERGYVPEGMSTQNAQLVGWKYGFMQYFKRRLSML